MMWEDDNSNLDEVAVAAVLEKRLVKPACCEMPDVHVYAHIHRASRGGLWAWCSHCGSFSHIDGVRIPNDWQNNASIDINRICAVPEYLEEHKDEIDHSLQEYVTIAKTA